MVSRLFHNLTRAATVALMLFTVASGCGKTELPAPTTVRGTVTFQGRPLAGGLIVFAPDPDKGTTGSPFRASIDADGHYKLMHESSSIVSPGWYRVAIADAPTMFANDATPCFPAALRRPDQAGLDREVRPGRENVLNFDIEVPE